MAIAEPDSDVATEIEIETMAELLERLGDLPPSRVLLRPQPGFATEADVLRLADAANPRYCELVDGVLVEKAMGLLESQIAGILIQLLNNKTAVHLTDADTLDGGDVLPGFTVSLAELFRQLD